MRFYFIGAFLLCSLSATFSQQKSSNSAGSTNTNSDSISNPKTKSYSLSEVSVSSLRAGDKSPFAYTNIDKETLSKSNFGQDIPYLLSTTSSLVTTSDAGAGVGYTGFRIRGTDASRINVTINGIPYNDADEQGAYWVDLPDFASSVQSIQVQRGVGSSTNGAGAFGANLSMQTDNHSVNPAGEFSLTKGSFNTQKFTMKASTGLINKHWAIDTRLSSISSDGYMDRATTAMKSFFVQAGYSADKTSVKLIAFGGTEKTYHAWDGVPKDSLATHRTFNPCGFMGDVNGKPLYYNNQTDNYTQMNYQLVAAHRLSSALNLNAALHYTKGDGYYEEYKKDQTLQNYLLSPYQLNGAAVMTSDLVRQKKMGNNFAGGVFSFNYQKDKLNAQVGGAVNQYWGAHFGEVWQMNTVVDPRIVSEYYRSKVDKSDANIYFKANYELFSKFNVYGELQYRYVKYDLIGLNDKWEDAISGMQKLNVDKKFNFANPKAGIYYQPDTNNDLFASVAIAHREPTRTNYTDGSATTWPTPETLYDYEAGYKFHDQMFTMGCNFYFMNYKDQLILTGKINDIGEALTSNIAKSYRAGVELVGGVKPISWMRWDGNLTLSQNKITDFTEYLDIYEGWDWKGQQMNKLSTTPIAFSPNITAGSLFSFTFGNLEANLQSQYVGSQFIDNSGSVERSLTAYFINNLRAHYNFSVMGKSDLKLSILVNNLANVNYISNAWVYSYYSHNSTAEPLQRLNDFGFYPQAGRNFLAMVTIKF